MANWRTQLHPELVRRLDNLLADAKNDGYDMRVVSAYRSHAEQDKLFVKRPRVTKARGGQSWHNYGLAADLAPFIDGKISWDEKKFSWSLIGIWAKAADLEWGGNWTSFKDRPHVQLIEDLTTQKASSLYKQGGGKLTKVWEYITENAEPANDLHKIAILKNSAAPATEQPAKNSNEDISHTAVEPADAASQAPPIVAPPLEQTTPAVTNTTVEEKVTESTAAGETTTITTAQSIAAPIEVKKETPSWMVKIGTAITAVAGFGINLGSLIQTKIEEMTPQQIGYMIAALALVAGAIYWWTKAAKAAQARTMVLVEKASDPKATTVVLVK